MVKGALVLCHSNADVERSLSTNKKMVTKSNTSLKPETLRGLRAIKCAIDEYGGVTKVPITLDMVSAVEVTQYLQAALKKNKKKRKRKNRLKKEREN